MLKLSSDNSNMLIQILNDRRNQTMILDLLVSILNLDIEKIYDYKIINSNINLDSRNSFIKLKADVFEKDTINIYIKLINKNKVKENIFLYWCLLSEKEIEFTKEQKEKHFINTVFDEVFIRIIESTNYKKTILLELKDENKEITKKETEIYLLNLMKYILKNKDNYNQLEKWKKYIDQENEDILFIGIYSKNGISRTMI